MSKPDDNGSLGRQDEVYEAKHVGQRGNTEKSHKGNESESNSSSASHDAHDGSRGVQDVGRVPKSQEVPEAEEITHLQKKNEELHVQIKLLEDENKQLRSEQSNNDMTLKKAIERVDVQAKGTAELHNSHQQENTNLVLSQRRGHSEIIPEITEEEEKILQYRRDLEELRGKCMSLENENKNLKEELSQKEIQKIELEEKANRMNEGTKGAHWIGQPKYKVDVQAKGTAELHNSHQQENTNLVLPQRRGHSEIIPEITEEEEKILQYRRDLEELRGKFMSLENENKNLKEELSQKEIQKIELEEKANRMNEGTKGAHWIGQPKYKGERPKSALLHGQHHIRTDPADLDKQIQGQDVQMLALVKQVRETKEACAMLANEKDALGVKVKQYENLLNSLKEEKNGADKEILRLKKDNDELLNRLSKVASDKLTHENSDITDLSDENRPIKLAEKMSELYDNQYTDAFDELKANHVADKDAVRFLLKILMETYKLCKDATLKRYKKLKKASSCFEISTLADGKDKTDKTVINDDLSIELQQDIRRIWRESSKSLLKTARSIIRNRVAAEFDFPVLTMKITVAYMTRCIDLCWMMNLQEKPMHLDASVQLKDGHPYFDSEKFRSYTRAGQYIAFVVWPALYLFKGGTMLKKGIAQGSSVAEGSSDQGVSCVTPIGDQTP